MAIAAVVRMKCVRLQPAGGGNPEVVDLEEETSNVTTESSVHVMPRGNKVPLATTKLVIDRAAAQGAFIKDKSYKVEFTAL